MEFLLDPTLKTRAALMLTLALIAMMAALVAHAGALDMTAPITHPVTSQLMQDSGCWCNEYICYCRPD